MKRLLIFGVLACLLAPTRVGAAGGNDVSQGAKDSDKRWVDSVQLVSGFIYSPVIQWEDRPTLNYSLTALRVSHTLSGNFDLLADAVYARVTKGAGDYMAGITLLVRYNFLRPDLSIVPYVQIGAGMVYNDIYKDKSQGLVGQSIEFTPQAALGIHLPLEKSWSLDFEAIFHHVSNAGLDERNVGINGLGGLLGVTYYFGKR